MDSRLETALDGIQAKTKLVVEAYKAAASERDVLQAENKSLREKVELQKKTINELEERYKVSKIAKAFENNESANDVKLKINELVREVEKCIALLNR